MTSLEESLTELRVSAVCRACRALGFNVLREEVRVSVARVSDLDRALAAVRRERSLVERICAPVRRWYFAISHK